MAPANPVQAFSILGRIERDATPCWRGHPRPISSFQYPRSDRAGCNYQGSASGGNWLIPFSILGRIERDATPHQVVSYAGCRRFQYPRSDRAGCNWTRRMRLGTGRILSVSSVGSSGMQQTDRSRRRMNRKPFSILGRIERDATIPTPSRPHTNDAFQYPRSDRAGCNVLCGHSGVKLRSAFSILGRIERDATHLLLPGDRGRGHFQYPRSDRAGCNAACVEAGSGVSGLSVSSVGSSGMQPPVLPDCPLPLPAFQYPRSDRAGCNRSAKLAGAVVCETFSILGRIERDATRERRNRDLSPRGLSVSSVGSSGMQLWQRVLCAGVRLFLSVSSVGSSGMQPHQGARSPAALLPFSILGRIERDATGFASFNNPGNQQSFSILGRIERDATSSMMFPPVYPTSFQYPRSDRAGCNR